MSSESKQAPFSSALVDCAMGRIPADMVIRNGQWVCVQTAEIIDQISVGIAVDHLLKHGDFLC